GFGGFWCICEFWAGEDTLVDRRPRGREAQMPNFKGFPVTDESDRTRVCGRRRAIVRRCTRTVSTLSADCAVPQFQIFTDRNLISRPEAVKTPKNCKCVVSEGHPDASRRPGDSRLPLRCGDRLVARGHPRSCASDRGCRYEHSDSDRPCLDPKHRAADGCK